MWRDSPHPQKIFPSKTNYPAKFSSSAIKQRECMYVYIGRVQKLHGLPFSGDGSQNLQSLSKDS